MKKRAMAIEIVLIFAAIMGFFGVALLKTTSQNNKQLDLSSAQLQSYFIARAGVEHTMLKIKYLHRELYDAICLYQGRNPLFNYTGIDVKQPYKNICATNPGPVFLYKSGEAKPETDSIITDLSKGAYKDTYKKWLDSFTKDLNSTYAENTCLDIRDPNKNKDIIEKMIPTDGSGFIFFAAEYGLKKDSLEISAFKVTEKDKKIENDIVINFTINSEYQSAKNTSYNYQISRTVTISRD